jgi:hypothetical protein
MLKVSSSSFYLQQPRQTSTKRRVFASIQKARRMESWLYDLRFPQRWLERVLSSGIQHRAVRWKPVDVSEEHVGPIFGISQAKSKREDKGDLFLRNVIYLFSGLPAVIFQKIEIFGILIACANLAFPPFQSFVRNSSGAKRKIRDK